MNKQFSAPLPPDLNVAKAPSNLSGSAVRNKRPILYNFNAVETCDLNIEIGGGGGGHETQQASGRFFRTYRYTMFACYIVS